jgi:hypothetical protein
MQEASLLKFRRVPGWPSGQCGVYTENRLKPCDCERCRHADFLFLVIDTPGLFDFFVRMVRLEMLECAQHMAAFGMQLAMAAVPEDLRDAIANRG